MMEYIERFYKSKMNNDMYNVMAPCKGCQDRQLACHDRCDKYKIYKEEINRIRIKDINQL